MRFLLVDCYRPGVPGRLDALAAMVRTVGDFVVRRDRELAPGIDDDSWDGVVISGSGDLVSRGQYRPAFLAWLRANRRPMLGICYGHQMLAFARGARVQNGLPVQRMVTVRRTRPSALLRDLGPSFPACASHREYVEPGSARAAGFAIVAASDACAVEAIVHERAPLAGVQFHPERTPPLGARVMANFARIASRGC